MSDVHERLRRLLFLVPYVSKHPGLTVEEVAKAAGCSRDQLIEELELLTFVGRPPFQPDDYIDIYVENGRVYVDLDQRLSAPPRLTADEAIALSAAAELLRPAPGDALFSAKEKLERALPAGVLARYRRMHQQIDAATSAPPGLAALTQAIGRRLEVEFDYFNPSRGVSERRTVRPRELFSHRGQWYLAAFCCARQDERLFRMDRIGALALTDRAFEPQPAPSRSVPNPVGAHGEVKVRFSAQAAPYVREQFGGQARPLPDGGVEVNVAADEGAERWLIQWVLGFGGEAVVESPQWARRAVARAAAASLESRSSE